MPADHAVENRTHEVLGVLADLMADLAFREDLFARRRVLGGGGVDRRNKGCPRNHQKIKPIPTFSSLIFISRRAALLATAPAEQASARSGDLAISTPVGQSINFGRERGKIAARPRRARGHAGGPSPRSSSEYSRLVTNRPKAASFFLRGTASPRRKKGSYIHELEYSYRRRSLRGHGSHRLFVGADVKQTRACPP